MIEIGEIKAFERDSLPFIMACDDCDSAHQGKPL